MWKRQREIEERLSAREYAIEVNGTDTYPPDVQKVRVVEAGRKTVHT